MQSTYETPEDGLEPFVPKFITDRLFEISDLKKQPNLERIQAHAHQWKGFSRPYGFGRLEQLALEIELHKSDLNKCLLLLEEAEKYCIEKQNK